jgi:hypothetical protein
MGCGYDLRGLSENRCPECGQAFDPGDPPPADVPWLHRREIGAWPAFWRTVAMAILHTGRLGDQVGLRVDVDPHAAKGFRRRCGWLAAGSVAVLTALILRPPLSVFTSWGEVMLVALSTVPGTLIFCTLGSVPLDVSAFDAVEQRTRFRWLQEFTAAPLAMTPGLPVMYLIAVFVADRENAAPITIAAGGGGLLLLWLACILRYQIRAAKPGARPLIGHTLAAVVLWIILGVAANAISTVIVALLIVSR